LNLTRLLIGDHREVTPIGPATPAPNPLLPVASIVWWGGGGVFRKVGAIDAAWAVEATVRLSVVRTLDPLHARTGDHFGMLAEP
jgi:hypothetical protein